MLIAVRLLPSVSCSSRASLAFSSSETRIRCCDSSVSSAVRSSTSWRAQRAFAIPHVTLQQLVEGDQHRDSDDGRQYCNPRANPHVAQHFASRRFDTRILLAHHAIDHAANAVHRLRRAIGAGDIRVAVRPRLRTAANGLFEAIHRGRGQCFQRGDVGKPIGIVHGELAQPVDLLAPAAHRYVIGLQVARLASQQVAALR
jgi:hypothetical protein